MGKLAYLRLHFFTLLLGITDIYRYTVIDTWI